MIPLALSKPHRSKAGLSRGGKKGEAEAKDPTDRIEIANDVARVQPRRAGYFNAVQVFPYNTGHPV